MREARSGMRSVLRMWNGVALCALIAVAGGCDSDPGTGLENGRITGTVRLDLGGGEFGPGVEGAEVQISGLGGFATTTTNQNGTFSFTGIRFGQWTVTMTPPDGYDVSPIDSATKSVNIIGAVAEVTFLVVESGG